MSPIRSIALRIAMLAGLALVALPGAAQAYWHGGWGGGWRGGGGCCWGGGGVWFGLPGVVYAPPPAYYYAPPPPYYAPPPASYAPPAYSAGPPGPGQACYAGQWVCPLERATPVGNACSCPTSSGPAWGRAQ